MNPDRFYVRPSALSSFFNCPLSVQLSQFLPSTAPTMQTTRGTMVHALIADHITTGSFVDLQVQDVVDMTRLEMDDRRESVDHVPSAALWKLGQEVLRAYHDWIEQFWNPYGHTLQPVVVEEKMEAYLGDLDDGREVWLKGTPDFVELDYVRDWKTSTAGWSQSKIDNEYQHLAYSLLVEQNHGFVPKYGQYVVYNFKTNEWEWDPHTVKITTTQLDRVATAYLRMGKVLAAEAAIGTPHKRGASWGQDGRGWWCSPKWCDAWTICDDKYILADGQAGEEVDPLITWK